MIRLTNQSKIERNFTLPDYLDISSKSSADAAVRAWKARGRITVRSAANGLYSAVRDGTEAADLRFVFPTATPCRIRLKQMTEATC